MKVIPCPHESGAVKDPGQEAPDYHPLTREEIAELLSEAKGSSGRLNAQIQIRLCQGIAGNVCPRPMSGPVFDKETEISRLYILNYQKGADPELVEQFY